MVDSAPAAPAFSVQYISGSAMNVCLVLAGRDGHLEWIQTVINLFVCFLNGPLCACMDTRSSTMCLFFNNKKVMYGLPG